jgi:PHP family Zn ribbon phosphoesterase
MSPREIVNAALEQGLELIAICDHNSAENVQAVRKAGERNGLAVVAGMEVTSSEEAHLLVYFDDDDDLLDFQKYIYEHLSGRNDEHSFGLQVIADDEDGVSGFCDKLLIAATTLSAEAVVAKARAAKGESLVIAAHVDRESFSIIGQLGFLPESLKLDAIEIARMTEAEFKKQHPDCAALPVVRSSDAHHPADLGKRFTWFTVADNTVAELKKALAKQEGRTAEC